MLNRTSTFTFLAFLTWFTIFPKHGNTQENGEGKSGKVESSYLKEIE
ncbi:MAG TPA: peptidase M20, partial [Runella sp.]|nr:peptidase M20 [Runella sp.]